MPITAEKRSILEGLSQNRGFQSASKEQRRQIISQILSRAPEPQELEEEAAFPVPRIPEPGEAPVRKGVDREGRIPDLEPGGIPLPGVSLRDVIEEAKAGREQLVGAVSTPPSGFLDFGARALGAVGGLTRMSFPIFGAGVRELAEEPGSRITGSPSRGRQFGGAIGVGLVAGSAIPTVARSLNLLSPLKQLTASEAGVGFGPGPQKTFTSLGEEIIGAPKVGAPVTLAEEIQPPAGVAAPAAKVAGQASGQAKAGTTAEALGKVKNIPFSETFEPGSNIQRFKRGQLAEDKYGYSLRTGDLVTSKPLQSMEDAVEKMGGTGFIELRNRNREVFARGVSKEAGLEAPELDAGWFQRMSDEFSAGFEEMVDEAGVIKLEDNFYEELASLTKQARISGAGGNIARIVANIRKELGNKATPAQYQEFRSELSAASRQTTDRDLARRLNSIITAFDGAATDSLPKGLTSKWQDLRRRYGIYRMLDGAVELDGTVNAEKMKGSLIKHMKGSFNRTPDGVNPVLDHVRIMSTFKDSIPTSGTAERLATMQQLQGVGTIARGALGFSVGDITGGLLAAGLPKGAEKGLQSKTLRDVMVARFLQKNQLRISNARPN